MTTIDDLGVSICDMPQEQLTAHIRSIRASRRISKKKVKTKTDRVITKSIDKLIGGLTPEQRKQLIEALE